MCSTVLLRERLERVADLARGARRWRRGTRSGSWTLAGRDDLAVAHDLAAADDDRVAVAEQVEERVVGQVDQVDAGLTSSSGPMFG